MIESSITDLSQVAKSFIKIIDFGLSVDKSEILEQYQ